MTRQEKRTKKTGAGFVIVHGATLDGCTSGHAIRRDILFSAEQAFGKQYIAAVTNLQQSQHSRVGIKAPSARQTFSPRGHKASQAAALHGGMHRVFKTYDRHTSEDAPKILTAATFSRAAAKAALS